MSKLFESQWQATKKALCEGKDLTHNRDGSLNPNKKKVMEAVLENTRAQLLSENATFGATSSANIASLNKVILPVLRRVMPTVIAHELVGVQAMSGPVGQISTLRIRYSDTVPAGGTGVGAGNEALSPFDIAAYYSGNATVASPAGANATALEGVAGNRLSVQMLKETVEAKTRRLSARWTIESHQDAAAQYGIDMESEIMAALAQEITAEIDQEIISTLIGLPGAPTATFAQSTVTGTPTFVGDVHAALAILINRQANLIASRTRQGSANWCVVSPTALTILQSAQTSAFARTTEGVFEAPTNTKFVGVLNNAMRVYVNQYAADATPVLVGLKVNDLAAGVYYCPYQPLMSSGVIPDPNTGEQVMFFMSRYGLVVLQNSSSSFGNSADYYGTIAIDTASLSFI